MLMSVATLKEYTLADLERLQRDHPEFGRVEIIGGTLIAGGADVTGDRHQSVVQALFLALMATCPGEHVVRLDTYWFGDGVRLRPDLAVWRRADRPADGGAFTAPPVAVVEVLSSDADHDLVRKAAVYAAHGVAAWFVDPARRHGWWIAADSGHRVSVGPAMLSLPGWPELEITEAILAD